MATVRLTSDNQLLNVGRISDSSMVSLTRDVEKWILSLDLHNAIHRPKWDVANGRAVAEILSIYHPQKVI